MTCVLHGELDARFDKAASISTLTWESVPFNSVWILLPSKDAYGCAIRAPGQARGAKRNFWPIGSELISNMKSGPIGSGFPENHGVCSKKSPS